MRRAHLSGATESDSIFKLERIFLNSQVIGAVIEFQQAGIALTPRFCDGSKGFREYPMVEEVGG